MVMIGFLDKPQGAEIIGDLGDYLDQIGDLGPPPVPPKILGIWGKSRRLLGIWIIWGTPVPPSPQNYWGFGVSLTFFRGFDPYALINSCCPNTIKKCYHNS